MKQHEAAAYFGIPRSYVNISIRMFLVTDHIPPNRHITKRFTEDQIGDALIKYFAYRKSYLMERYSKPDLFTKLKSWDQKTEMVQSKLNTI